jgi:hypothetical protein
MVHILPLGFSHGLLTSLGNIFASFIVFLGRGWHMLAGLWEFLLRLVRRHRMTHAAATPKTEMAEIFVCVLPRFITFQGRLFFNLKKIVFAL